MKMIGKFFYKFSHRILAKFG